MSVLAPTREPKAPDATFDDDVGHYSWEDNGLVALCGKRLRGIESPELPVCALCEALADALEAIEERP